MERYAKPPFGASLPLVEFRREAPRLRPSGVNTITGYGAGYVMVNGERRASSVVVLADRVEDWTVENFEALSAEHFEFLKTLDIEILLLGTGLRQRFPHPWLTAALAVRASGSK